VLNNYQTILGTYHSQKLIYFKKLCRKFFPERLIAL